jgi:hypothetical protein
MNNGTLSADQAGSTRFLVGLFIFLQYCNFYEVVVLYIVSFPLGFNRVAVTIL